MIPDESQGKPNHPSYPLHPPPSTFIFHQLVVPLSTTNMTGGCLDCQSNQRPTVTDQEREDGGVGKDYELAAGFPVWITIELLCLGVLVFLARVMGRIFFPLLI